MVTRHKRERESAATRERRLATQRAYQRKRYDPVKNAEYSRRFIERIKNGEADLPPLDWAICARGGSEAQARAHQRRGEPACPACRQACRDACQRRADAKRRSPAS